MGTNAACFWRAGKHDGDGKQLAAWQSMVSGGAAAILGPTVTNPFDVVKVGAAQLTCDLQGGPATRCWLWTGTLAPALHWRQPAQC